MSTTMDQVVKKAKDSFGPMFDKSLHDLVRGIRNHKDNEAKYINEAIDEIKQELKQDNMAIKANAVNKLTYLQMLGYDISWSSFNIIEVMSSNKFTFKRIGYLAASQSFHEGTDVLMLTTNMIRKDLNSSSMYEAGIAMSGLSCFINADLARDLANDIMSLMTSTKPYIRKRAVLLLYKVFLNNPDALKPAFPRLREKLEDSDPGVQAAAVNVICELARRNPKNYLALAPIFFRLMTTSANNWVLIKIIKLFGALTPLEPRLGKKLIEPLTNLIHSTSAMSLLYECINTVIAVLVSISSGLPNHNASIQLCVQKLRILIEDSDQNLKYLGLLAMSKILQTHPKSVQAHHDLIMQCLDDKDESIRLRALDLLSGMVSRKNLMDVVRKLMVHMNKAEGTHYRDELLSKIIDICSQNDYQHITNFEWYISILVELTRLEGTKHGGLISLQLLDVAVRVDSIREFACHQMAVLLENAHVFILGSNSTNIAEVLYAAAWICGEFSSHLKNPQKTLESMLNTKITLFSGHIQSVYYQNILKIITYIITTLDNNETAIKELVSMSIDKMSVFLSSGDVEAQERASVILNVLKSVLKLIEKHEFNVNELSALFDGVLNPVAAKAQRKVAIPTGLDLDAWINDPPSESDDESVTKPSSFDKTNNPSLFYGDNRENYYHGSNLDSYSGDQSGYNKPKNYVEPTAEELEEQREKRKQSEKMNPFYLKDTTKIKSTQKTEVSPTISNNADRSQATSSKGTIPANLQLSLADQLYRQAKIDEENRRLKKKSKSDGGSSKKGKKTSKNSDRTTVDENDDDLYPTIKVTRGGELPEGVTESGNEDNDNDEPVGKNKKHDPHRALNIDLDEKSIQKMPTLPTQVQEPITKPVENPPPITEKQKKSKKKKTVEKEEKSSTSKSKHKRERSDYKELLSPADDEKKSVVPSPSNTTAAAPPATTTTEEKPKKKKTKEKKPINNDNSAPLLFDIMSDDINPTSGSNQQYSELNVYKPTAESDYLTIETSIIPTPSTAQLDVTFLLKNRTSSIIDHIDVHVIDSLSSKLINTTSTNHVSFPSISLFPYSQNYIHIYFAINAISFPQKLKTSMTYSINKASNDIQTDTIEFKLDLPCSQYLRKKSLDSDAFAELMSSGTLTSQSRANISSSSQDFSSLINTICQTYRLTVVDKINSAASLYAETILGHPIALLFKSTNSQSGISIDGKSTETHFLSNLIEEIKNFVK
ncbi:unnamed protein product [Rotaria sp. Silwood1]|nr:unnamed protein product [Rotaria sp. Silwood1]CAF3419921.1 unnamed protein product [Rotaria sp. Silwood1]CAF3444903.1 unnamed protein product [Rotaria sp. Silwood1]CAF4730231.1 unnamed protein product [Rotaria sp. Silwood1]CAF4793683.1 unnamed protein product [Rotaria sp. Silwood1]